MYILDSISKLLGNIFITFTLHSLSSKKACSFTSDPYLSKREISTSSNSHSPSSARPRTHRPHPHSLRSYSSTSPNKGSLIPNPAPSYRPAYLLYSCIVSCKVNAVTDTNQLYFISRIHCRSTSTLISELAGWPNRCCKKMFESCSRHKESLNRHVLVLLPGAGCL